LEADDPSTICKCRLTFKSFKSMERHTKESC
jgi:hypothetical protein